MDNNIVQGYAGDNGEGEFFNKKLVPVLKGFAIIFMFMLHLLQTSWMAYPELIIDFRINGNTISSIIAKGGDICIGIFAFISGYGWCSNFSKKRKRERLFGVGGIYSVYWLVLILFSFPIRVLFSFLEYGSFPQLTIYEVIESIVAVSSRSVRFQWYIYFFAMAVLTYKAIASFTDKISYNPILLIYMVCFLFFGGRCVSKVLFTNIIPSKTLLAIFSHYCQWMPVIITGHIAKRNGLYEKIIYGLSRRTICKYGGAFCLISALFIYIGKCMFMFLTGIGSNFDFLLMFPFMFFLIGIAKWITEKTKVIKILLEKLGAYSNYLWLTHSFILYPVIQAIVFRLRLPILILGGSFVIMFPIAVVIKTVDMSLRNLKKYKGLKRQR